MTDEDPLRIEDALRAAQRYYVHNVTMDLIGREMHKSRSTISRLIAYAKESGLVEIRVMPPSTWRGETQEALEHRYGIRAHVVHAEESTTPVELHQRTAAHAIRTLNSVLASDMTLIVSWGTMLREISDGLPHRAITNCRVAMVNGIGNTRTIGEHYSSAILAAFGSAYNAYVQRLPLPIFFDHPDSRRMMRRESAVQNIERSIADAEIALFSLGTVEHGVPAAPYRAGYFLDHHDFASLEADDVVGDIATSFIRADGTHAGIAMNERTSGPDLYAFARIPHRICAVSGTHKIAALHAALVGGFITDLVIDPLTAQLLLDQFGGHNGSGPNGGPPGSGRPESPGSPARSSGR